MADLNGVAVFATTGTYKDYIAWIDFTKNVNLLTSGPLTVENTLPDGYTVEFTISGQLYDPDNPDAALWTATPNNVTYGYLGKGVTYNLIPPDPYFAAGGRNFILTLSNIVVKKNGTPIKDYLFIVGDAEITTSGEVWSISSSGAVWQVLDLVENHVPVESPILSGIGTDTVTFEGVNYNTGTYILQSYNVKEITVDCPSVYPAGLVTAFGIVVNLPPEIVKTANPTEIDNVAGSFAKFKATFTPTNPNILSYTLTDTISQSTGLSYIPISSSTTPKTTITQNGNPITVTENISGTEVVFSINSSNLTLNVPVELDLVYRLDETLPVNSITNYINIEGMTAAGPTPKLHSEATVNLKKVLVPKVTKLPESQEVLIKDGEKVTFKITATDLKYDPATNNYSIVDKLDPHLLFDATNSSLTVTVGGVTTNLPLVYTIDSNNVLTVTAPSSSVPQDAILTLNIAATVKDASTIPPGYKALNTANLVIDNDPTKKYTSNEVVVLFVTNCYRALSDVVESIALQEAALAHILNAEGEKIQKLLTLTNVTKDDILNVNKSVNNMVKSIAMLEIILYKKLTRANKPC